MTEVASGFKKLWFSYAFLFCFFYKSLAALSVAINLIIWHSEWSTVEITRTRKITSKWHSDKKGHELTSHFDIV